MTSNHTSVWYTLPHNNNKLKILHKLQHIIYFRYAHTGVCFLKIGVARLWFYVLLCNAHV